ncbi:hypothetical protein BKA62DRAFT_277486 [Auriculariales sp. MPI-PUGE-AT-0066]|nr:hypothetical protein BKA62DRAFT_277486 [Auriculariales sp. MPI-PUGE-AT-0066]
MAPSNSRYLSPTGCETEEASYLDLGKGGRPCMHGTPRQILSCLACEAHERAIAIDSLEDDDSAVDYEITQHPGVGSPKHGTSDAVFDAKIIYWRNHVRRSSTSLHGFGTPPRWMEPPVSRRVIVVDSRLWNLMKTPWPNPEPCDSEPHDHEEPIVENSVVQETVPSVSRIGLCAVTVLALTSCLIFDMIELASDPLPHNLLVVEELYIMGKIILAVMFSMAVALYREPNKPGKRSQQ